MIVEKFEFPNARGESLAAVLDRPPGEPRAYALFAHCFTCGKDVLAARRLAAALTEHGLAVVRFDFTGLGASEGEFANTNFTSNVADLVAAAHALREQGHAPAVLIGHSLGGAAVLAAAGDVPEARAVVTIGAPFDPAHVAHSFPDQVEAIRRDGEGEVKLAGRPFRITRAFLDDVFSQRQAERIEHLHKALVIFHSPEDETVGVENATQIFRAAKHPKSFISLEKSDHLLTDPGDAAYVGGVIAAAVERYLPAAAAPSAHADGAVVVGDTGFGRFQQAVVASGHRIYVDEPVDVGGLATGPTPYDLVLAGLGACTSMTVRLYAERKGWPLEHVEVRLEHDRDHALDCENCEADDSRVGRIRRELRFEGPLSEEQRARLVEIAEKCPVHRTLAAGVLIETTLAAG
ncbi:MAG TPA: bifunctional alpha/beta hydrolase/OsmC family protein [Caulobacteraceae bacterium]|jgi:putative redox protein